MSVEPGFGGQQFMPNSLIKARNIRDLNQNVTIEIDGGIKDNMPIRPLYIEGIRNFIVVGLSTESKINYDLYPDANFLFIKPRKSIGDFWDGTLDFTSKGARIRMEIGYMDAIREIEFYGRDDFESKEKYKIQELADYQKLGYQYRQMTLEDCVDSHMNDINRLLDRYK